MKKKLLGIGLLLSILSSSIIFAKSQISIEQAKSIALSKIPGATIKSIELDHDFGKMIYDIDLILNQYEYDLKLDASTGSGLSVKKELRDDYKVSSTPSVGTNIPSTNSNTISYGSAQSIAVAQVPGATITDLEYEREENIYEISLQKDYLEYDVVINALTGDVLYCGLDD